MQQDPKSPRPEDTTAAPPRRPYHAPRLRPLGSVRDLTLGSTGARPDTRFTTKM
jgi:hypothetical protein